MKRIRTMPAPTPEQVMQAIRTLESSMHFGEPCDSFATLHTMAAMVGDGLQEWLDRDCEHCRRDARDLLRKLWLTLPMIEAVQ